MSLKELLRALDLSVMLGMPLLESGAPPKRSDFFQPSKLVDKRHGTQGRAPGGVKPRRLSTTSEVIAPLTQSLIPAGCAGSEAP